MRNLLVAVALLFCITSFSQKAKRDNLSPSEKTQKFLMRWGRELNLTSEQQTKAEPGILGMYTKFEQLRADSSMEKKSRNRAMSSARKNGIDAFKAILSPEQVVLYDKKMQEMKEAGKSQKGSGDPKGGKPGVKKAAEEELENENIF